MTQILNLFDFESGFVLATSYYVYFVCIFWNLQRTLQDAPNLPLGIRESQWTVPDNAHKMLLTRTQRRALHQDHLYFLEYQRRTLVVHFHFYFNYCGSCLLVREPKPGASTLVKFPFSHALSPRSFREVKQASTYPPRFRQREDQFRCLRWYR